METESDSLYGEDDYDHVFPGLIYITSSCPGPGVDMDLYCSVPKGCDCKVSCEICLCSCFNQHRKEIQPLLPLQLLSDPTMCFNSDLLGPITECNDDCSCGKECFNRKVQNGPRRGLEVLDIGTKGFGVITKRKIPDGAFICEYAGEIIGVEEAKNRFKLLKESDANYILVLREHFGTEVTNITVIDPTVIGNIGRYLNHSCRPNVRVVPVRTNSLIPVAAIFALKSIEAGEELCYDYDGISNSFESDFGSVPLPNNHDSLQCSSLSKNLVSSVLPDSISGWEHKETNVKQSTSGNTFAAISRKPCLCLSKQCRQFLPANPNIFG